jgi:hypothetical protein
MKLMSLAVAVAATLALGHCAQAHVHHRRSIRRHEIGRFALHRHRVVRRRIGDRREAADRPRQDAIKPWRGGYGSRPSAWCGWEMRHLVSRDPGPAYNLARNWAHWGNAGPAAVGAIVVWPHHVGKIVGREGGRWVIESGNDGHRLRTRPRSIAGAIAIRQAVRKIAPPGPSILRAAL